MTSRKEYEMLFKLESKLGSSYTSSFKSAQSAISGLQSEIKTLNKAQAEISAYQKQQTAINATERRLASYREQLKNVQKELAETENPTSALANKEVQLREKVGAAEDKLRSQTDRLNNLGASLESAGIKTDDLSGESKRLASELDALEREESEAAKEAENFGDESVDAFETIASAMATAGIAKGLQEIADAYMECVNAAGGFESSMSNVEALSGASEEELAQLSDMAKEMGATTSFTATQSADAFGYMALAGWDVESMLEGISPVLNLAAAANMDLAEASDIVTDYLTAFGLTAQDTSSFVDMMAYAMANSNTNVTQLGEAYKACAATAHSMGYSVEETTAVLMTMANAGVKGGEAGTALNAIMTRLATNTKDCADELANYGVNVYDSQGKMQSLSSILTGTAQVWGTLTDQEQAALAKSIAGTNQYSKLQTIMAGCSETAEAGGQSFTDYANALENSSGAAGNMAATMLDNVNGKLTLLESAFDGLKIAVGEEFTPAMSGLYEVGADILSGATEFVKQNPAIIKAGTAFVSIVGLATAGLTGYAAIVKTIKLLDMATIFAGPAGTILKLTAAAAGLIAAGVGIATAINEDELSMKNLTAQARELKDAIDDASSSYESSVGDTEAAAAVADKYISRLEEQEAQLKELQAAGQDTTAVQQQYHATLSVLCETIPELADYIDLTTDTITGGTAALRTNTEEWKKNALAQAYQEKLSAIYSEYADVLIEAEKNQIGLTNATQDYNDAVQAQQDHAARMNEILAKAADEVGAYNNANGTLLSDTEYLATVYPELYDEYCRLNDALSDDADAINDADYAMGQYTDAIAADEDAVNEAQAAITEAEEAVDRLTGATADGTSASSEYADQMDSISAAAEGVSQQMQALIENYNTAYEAAYNSISGQYALWDEAEQVSSTSISTINANLESQAQHWADYNANLQNLSARSSEIAGLSDVIASFADGSDESVAAIAGMASASDADLQQMVANWQSVQQEQEAASDALADLSTDFSSTMDQLAQQLAADIDAMDLSTEAAAAGKSTINGYISSIVSQESAAYNAAKRVADAAAAALNGKIAANHTTATSTKTTRRNQNAYASGTDSAAPGIALVGEDGPELVEFRGGEKVYTADETAALREEMQLTAIMPQTLTSLMGAERVGAINALSDDRREGTTYSIALSPVYNISGSANTSELDAVLRQHDEDLREYILDVIQEHDADAMRRSYT